MRTIHGAAAATPEHRRVPNQNHVAAQRAHLCVLGVHLVDVRHTLCQHCARNAVAVLELELRRLLPSALHLGSGVGCDGCKARPRTGVHDNAQTRSVAAAEARDSRPGGRYRARHARRTQQARHDAADLVGDVEHVGHGVGIHQLIHHLLLCDHHSTVVASDGHGRQARGTRCLECVLCTPTSHAQTIRGQHATTSHGGRSHRQFATRKVL